MSQAGATPSAALFLFPAVPTAARSRRAASVVADPHARSTESSMRNLLLKTGAVVLAFAIMGAPAGAVPG